MAQTGNPTQWPATYPGAELMQQQIARGVCYVLEGNARPEATFCYIPGPEPTYAEIYDGGWPDDAPYATIPPHGIGPGGCMGRRQSALPGARPRPALRADTHADNKVMQHLLEKNGFVRCGNITLADGTFPHLPTIALCRRAGANSKLLPRPPQRWPRQPKLCPNQPTARCWLHWMAAAPRAKPPLPHESPAIRLGCGALG